MSITIPVINSLHLLQHLSSEFKALRTQESLSRFYRCEEWQLPVVQRLAQGYTESVTDGFNSFNPSFHLTLLCMCLQITLQNELSYPS